MEDNIRVIETLVMHEASERTQLWEIYNQPSSDSIATRPFTHGGFSQSQFDSVLPNENFS